MSFLLIINIPWPLCIISFLLIFYILYINIVLHLSLITNIFSQLCAYLLAFFSVLDSDNGYSVWQMAARVVFSTAICSVHSVLRRWCPWRMLRALFCQHTWSSLGKRVLPFSGEPTATHPPTLENHFFLLCAVNKTLRSNLFNEADF